MWIFYIFIYTSCMQIPTKKLKNGFEIPILWMGTWMMWGMRTHDVNNDDIKDIKALQYAISKWFTCIDSAEMYAEGYSEILLWKAIKSIPREELFISSKVKGDNCSYIAVKDACHNSLKRLEIKYLDLYYIHWRDESFSLEDTMRAMNELVDEWYIRHIWVSNFSIKSMKEAQKYSRHPIVANQVHLNLIYREPEVSGLLRYCQENDIMVVAWRPFEYWEFSTTEAQNILNKISGKYHKTHFQIALNWLVSQKNIVTLFKSSTTKNIDENIQSIWWKLSQEDINTLKKDFPWQQSISNAVPLG